MSTNQIVLASRPKGKPVLENFEIKSIELPEIKEGEILLAPMFYSVDPYMRGRMNDAKSYTPPFEVGKPITGGGVAKVIKSNKK
jgi:NADPH:quinone reductase